MEKLLTLSAPTVVFVAAVVANVDAIAVGVDSQGNFISEEIFVALCAKQIFLLKATRANVGAVVNKSHLASVVIFLTMLAEAEIFVQAVVADLNTLAVAINDFPCFRAIVLALLTEFATVMLAILAEKFRRNFAGAGNAQPVGAYIENLEVVLMVVANGNFGVEVWVRPVRITAKAVTASDVNAMFVTAIFFRLPEIGHAFELSKFALNQIAIKLGFGLRATSTAVGVVEPTLKQKPVLRLVHEELPRRFTVVESFGVVRVGGSEDDKGHVVASVAGTAAVVVAIENVKGVAGNHRRTAIISFRITHRQEVRGINRHEKLEVNFLAGKLVGELREEMLKLTSRA